MSSQGSPLPAFSKDTAIDEDPDMMLRAQQRADLELEVRQLQARLEERRRQEALLKQVSVGCHHSVTRTDVSNLWY
jgi:hypothetical protein